MKHFGFPSIEQFRHAVKTIRDRCEYHGIPRPVIRFKGTVKLHGTNAGVVQDLRTGEIWAQSREQLITPQNDNAGFAQFVAANGIHFQSLFKVAQDLCGTLEGIEGRTHLAIFGEWCGQGIMKGVAIAQVPKRFVIFGVRVITDHEEHDKVKMKWFTPEMITEMYNRWLPENPPPIFQIHAFKTFTVDIDFERPELAQNELTQITTEVERECPVGLAFGVSGVGEGVVWKVDGPCVVPNAEDIIFKVKGEKHSDTKVKKLVEVDVEKVENARAFAAATVTEHRMEKMLEKLKEQGLEVDVKNTGAFLKLVGQDVIKEELDRLTASGLEWKDVASHVNTVAKTWWMAQANKF